MLCFLFVEACVWGCRLFAKLPHRNTHCALSFEGYGEWVPDYQGPFTLPLNVVRKTSFKVWQFGEPPPAGAGGEGREEVLLLDWRYGVGPGEVIWIAVVVTVRTVRAGAAGDGVAVGGKLGAHIELADFRVVVVGDIVIRAAVDAA